MAVALILLTLVALMLFIGWERRDGILGSRSAKRHARESYLNEMSTARNFVRGCLGLALMTLILALSEWTSPSTRPYTGRWSWLKETLFSILGPIGPALLWAVIAAALLLAASTTWRHTAKKPTDRLF